MLKRNLMVTVLLLTMSIELLGAVANTGQIINNTKGSDYRITESESNKIFNAIKSSEEIHPSYTESNERVKSGTDVIDSLIEDNILNRDSELDFSNTGIEIKRKEIDSSKDLKRTEVLMYLDKIKNGNLTSRSFTIKTIKNEKIEDSNSNELGKKLDNIIAKYKNTDKDMEYAVYVNNSVPELYLSRLLKNGIINESELSNKKFLTDYQRYSANDAGVVPEWSDNLQGYIYNESANEPSQQLGSTWEFKDFFKLFSDKALSFKAIQKTDMSFFVSESISKMETYDYIYEMYHNSLKQFSDAERQALVLKYGSREINTLDLKEQNRMYTLIYNGIIDREDSNEVNYLSDNITGKLLFDILFRLKHPDERVACKLDKLNSEESSLAQQGFVRNDISIFNGDRSMEPITLSIKKVDNLDPEPNRERTSWYIPLFGDKDSTDESKKEESKPWYTRAKDAIGTAYTYTKNSIGDFNATRTEEIHNTAQDYKDGKIGLAKAAWDMSGFVTLGEGASWYYNAAKGNDVKMQEKSETKYEPRSASKDNEKRTESVEKDIKEEEVDNKNKDTSVKSETKDGKESKETATSNEQDKSLGDSTAPSIGATEKGEPANYQLEKVYPNPDKVEYKGVKISDVTMQSPKNGYITSVSKTSKGAVKITYKLQASSDVEALAIIDSATTYDIDNDDVKTLQTVTKVQGGKRGAVYISAKEMERSMGELVVVSNKVLKNKKTGAVAVLLSDHHKAMIGNRVVATDEPIAITNTADTYYNMEFLAPLMSNGYISSIDPEKLFLDNTLPLESIAQVNCSGSNLEKTMIIQSKSWDSGLFSGDETYFNLDMVTRGISCLTRELNIEGKKAYVIIDWAYSLPGNDDTILNYFKDNNLNVKEASQFLFTKPSGEQAEDWWNSNLGISNGLANALYDTKGIKYITSGYLKPDVTILLPQDGASEEDVTSYLTKKLSLNSDYLKKYCEGTANSFETKLFNGGSGDVTGRRTLRVIKGEASKNNGESKRANINKYEEEYATTATGAIYRNIKKDNRMSYDATNKVLNVSGRQINEDANQYQSVIKIGSKSYYVQRLGSTTMTAYLALTDMDGIVGKLGTVSNKGFGLTSDLFDNFDEVTKRINEDIADLTKNIDGCEAGDFKEVSSYEPNTYSMKVSDDYYRKDNQYLVAGDLIEGKATSISNPFGTLSANKLNNSAIIMPTIYINAGKYGLQNGKLEKKVSLPYLEQGNVLFSGLNSTLMSKLIDKNAEVISYKDLPSKANVIIQDVMYKKTANGLQSAPIKDTTFANELAQHSMEASTINSLILRRFEGLQLMFSGRSVSFTSYITKCDIGTLEFEDTNNTYYLKGKVGYYSSAKGEEALYKGQDLTSACISIVPDNDTQFYLLDSSTNTYEVRYFSDKYCDGYIDDVSAFSEDLGFNIPQDNMLELKNNIYKPDADYLNLFNNYKLVYQQMLKGDIISILQFLLTAIISYIILVTWIGLMILKGNVGLSILLNLRNPSGVKGAEGFDFIKVISAGVWNLDSEPRVPLVVIADLILFTLLYLVIDCGTIIKFMFY